MTGSWYSQRFRPDGGITAEGLRNQLGRPALSLPTVLVRESAQNSWDARTEAAIIDFSMELGAVGPAHISAWRNVLRAGSMQIPAPSFPLTETLRGPSIRYLSISDRGTKGLGGPTRSDHAAAPGTRNWLSFVLNSGEARDTDGGGGTYGYGKGIFFLASQVGAIIIHSRFREERRLRQRLIGSVLWSSYTSRDIPYTGRHWWGRAQDDHCEPLTDDEAEETARSLGLPTFRGSDTGTTVTIIEPNLLDPAVPEEESAQLPPEEAGRFLAEAMAWNLWPLTLAERPQRLQLALRVDGRDVSIPDENSDATLAHFATAYRRMKSSDGESVECKRPKRRLGSMAIEKTFGAKIRAGAAADLGLVEDLSEGEAPHHVCLMRTPELVVKYQSGPKPQHPDVGYAGVLRVDNDLDPTFAKSEPPTHDAWIDSQLHGAEATFVRVVHRRIRERCDEIAGARRARVVVESRPAGGVARKLGHLLSGSAPAGAGVGAPSLLPATAAGAAPARAGFSGGGSGVNGNGATGSTGRGAGRGPGRARLEGAPRGA